MQEQAVWYEPHPCSPQRKAELRAQGYRIVDAAFAPDGWQAPEARSGETSEDLADTNGNGYMSVAEIRAALDERGIEYDPKARRPELLALLKG